MCRNNIWPQIEVLEGHFGSLSFLRINFLFEIGLKNLEEKFEKNIKTL